ncbi:thioredoxin fold domain-containing protein, partial [bacterium]|nr:thioredoxin fold domain-containing protein [bacterium]
MKALNIFLCIVFLIGLADFTIAAKDEVTSITFLEDKSFEEITVILKKENKLGVLYFGGPNCGWCVKLEKEVFMVDSVITYIESNFVPFKCGSELRKKYTVFGIPHAIIINERGDVVDRIAGYYPADKYLKKLSVSAMDNVSKSEPKKEKTYKNLKEAYEANPDDKKTAYDYAYKLMNTGDMGSALPVFESITNVSFDDEVKDAWVLLDLARCYEMADRKMKPSEPYRKKAVKTYEKAIEIGLPSEIQKVKTYGQLVFHSFNGKEYDKVIKYASMIPEPKKYENRRDMRINYEAKFNRIYLPFAYYYIGDEDMGRKELIKLFENTAKEESPYSILQRWTGYCHMYNIFLKEAEEWAG